MVHFRQLQFFNLLSVIFSFIILFLFPRVVICSAFDVTPTHLYLSNKEPISTLRVTNPGNDYEIVQLQLFRWIQVQGINNYTPTRDLLAVPKLFRIPPHGTQLIRVALYSKPDEAIERAYRLYLKEVLPTQTDILQKNAYEKLRIALRISLPIFVLPKTPLEKHWEWIGRWREQGNLELTLKNTGNTTLFINQLSVYTKNYKLVVSKPKIFVYILPYQQYHWLLKTSLKNKLQSAPTPSIVKANIDHHATISDVHQFL